MASKTVLSDAEITRPPRPRHATAWLTKRGNSAPSIPAPPSSTDASNWVGRVASLGHHAVGRLTHWIASYSIVLLRLSLGGIFFWFGLLKFFPALSPAEALATRTLDTLTLGYLAPHLAILLLALWETAIGLGLLLGVCPSLTLTLLFLHMVGTFTPLVLFPHEVFAHIPYAPTFEAQYILKNVVLISAGCVLGASRGRRAGDATPVIGSARKRHPGHDRADEARTHEPPQNGCTMSKKQVIWRTYR
jgi:uncharacterized membrane protein YphA (DoxX/SURF4 family)